ncbi:MAG: ABC-F family ATP-binding cassette domain-containing protein [Clostridiales bacterium]|nr:ABC-F family ATP-binding cassette domain-containing protein [Clostridiales bacterium]
MVILTVKDIEKSFGTDIVIKNASFAVDEYDKIGIVGINGAGKSTLFKIICGETEKDSGEMYIGKNKNIGYMSQFLDFHSGVTLWEEVLKAFSDIIVLEKNIKKLEVQISKLSKIGESADLSRLMKTYSDLQQKFEMADGFSYESKIKGVLKGLGFLSFEYGKKVSEFSGGQKTRIALAKVLLKKYDILLLDEPTNYLDIESVEWLENFLKSYSCALMIISHDRYLLDNITDKTYEIENGILKEYEGNYSTYMAKKEKDKAQQFKDYENQQKEIIRQEAIIARFKQYNREKSIKQAESREKMLQRIGRLEKPDGSIRKPNFIFEPKKRSGNIVVVLEGISKAYDQLLFDNINLEIRRGEKIALLGPNGIGKTTLLKIIAGKIKPDTGNIRYGASVVPSYYDQEQDDLDFDKMIIDEIWDSSPRLSQAKIRNALAAFLFKGEEVFKEVSVLSGGEKSRLSLLKMMLSKANFLLLDEPTNHLDMQSREVLEESLKNYTGTVLFISHDRYFLNKVATEVIELKDNTVDIYKGGYSYYIKNRPNRNLEKNMDDKNNAGFNEFKNDWILRKEEKATIRRQEKRLVDIENEIHANENRLNDIDTLLESPEVFSNHVKCHELNTESLSLKNNLEKLYDEWALLSEDLNF